MLVNLRDMCAIAEQYNMAIGSFNTPNMESLRATIIAAEETHLPVMISHAQVHEPIAPLDLVGPAMVALAERSSALICVHLDHCEDLSYMRRALEMGFNGAMYDGSALPYQRNIENSQRAAAMCASFDCGLECEIGSMGDREAGERGDGLVYLRVADHHGKMRLLGRDDGRAQRLHVGGVERADGHVVLLGDGTHVAEIDQHCESFLDGAPGADGNDAQVHGLPTTSRRKKIGEHGDNCTPPGERNQHAVEEGAHKGWRRGR
jgi:hypothetical protein